MALRTVTEYASTIFKSIGVGSKTQKFNAVKGNVKVDSGDG